MRGGWLKGLWKGSGREASSRGYGKDSLEGGNDLDGIEPRVLEDHLGRGPRPGIGVQHPLDDIPALAGDEVGQRRRRGGLRVKLEVGAEGRVGGFGDAPGELLKVHAVEDDGAGPDVDEAGVVLCDGRAS